MENVNFFSVGLPQELPWRTFIQKKNCLYFFLDLQKMFEYDLDVVGPWGPHGGKVYHLKLEYPSSKEDSCQGCLSSDHVV